MDFVKVTKILLKYVSLFVTFKIGEGPTGVMVGISKVDAITM